MLFTSLCERFIRSGYMKAWQFIIQFLFFGMGFIFVGFFPWLEAVYASLSGTAQSPWS